MRIAIFPVGPYQDVNNRMLRKRGLYANLPGRSRSYIQPAGLIRFFSTASAGPGTITDTLVGGPANSFQLLQFCFVVPQAAAPLSCSIQLLLNGVNVSDATPQIVFEGLGAQNSVPVLHSLIKQPYDTVRLINNDPSGNLVRLHFNATYGAAMIDNVQNS